MDNKSLVIIDNEKIFETGKIIFANLVLSGQENQLFLFIDKKKKRRTLRLKW